MNSYKIVVDRDILSMIPGMIKSGSGELFFRWAKHLLPDGVSSEMIFESLKNNISVKNRYAIVLPFGWQFDLHNPKVLARLEARVVEKHKLGKNGKRSERDLWEYINLPASLIREIFGKQFHVSFEESMITQDDLNKLRKLIDQLRLSAPTLLVDMAEYNPSMMDTLRYAAFANQRKLPFLTNDTAFIALSKMAGMDWVIPFFAENTGGQ